MKALRAEKRQKKTEQEARRFENDKRKAIQQQAKQRKQQGKLHRYLHRYVLDNFLLLL